MALFEKYAGQYDFDYLMVGAQAYQESGLDQQQTQSRRGHRRDAAAALHRG